MRSSAASRYFRAVADIVGVADGDVSRVVDESVVSAADKVTVRVADGDIVAEEGIVGDA